MRLNWLITGQKAGMDESKLGRGWARVHTGKELLDHLDQRNRPNFGKLNLTLNPLAPTTVGARINA